LRSSLELVQHSVVCDSEGAVCSSLGASFISLVAALAVKISVLVQRQTQLFDLVARCDIVPCKPSSTSGDARDLVPNPVPPLTSIEPFSGPDAGELADRWRQAGALWEARQRYILNMQAALPEWSRARLPFFSESASILPPASTVPALPRAALSHKRFSLLQLNDDQAQFHGPSQSPAGLFAPTVHYKNSLLHLLYPAYRRFGFDSRM